jgi:hypothetical protein
MNVTRFLTVEEGASSFHDMFSGQKMTYKENSACPCSFEGFSKGEITAYKPLFRLGMLFPLVSSGLTRRDALKI